MNDVLLVVVAVPFAIGAAIAFATLWLRAGARAAALSFLLPAGALLAFALNEGAPPFPPLAAKQKLPYLLLIAAIAGPLFTIPAPARRVPRWLLALAAVVASLFWVGRSVAWVRPTSPQGMAAYALGLLALAALALAARAGDEARADSVLTVAGAFWQACGGAVAALFAPYVGAAQTLGAWAATLGGFLLVGYLARLTGRRDALSAPDMAGFNAAWVSFLLLMMPLMFATSGSRSAYLVAGAAGLAPLLSGLPAAWGKALPEFLRPVVLGVAPAVPVSIAVALAVTGIL
jgi:hypothetical protein